MCINLVQLLLSTSLAMGPLSTGPPRPGSPRPSRLREGSSVKPPTHQPFMPPRLASRVPSCSHLIAVPHPPTCFCFPPSSSSLHPANAHSSKRVTLTVTRANTSVSLTVCQALARPPYINHPVYSLQQVRGELLPSCPGDVTVQGSGKVSKWPLVFCTSTPSVGRVVVTAN